MNKVYIGNSLPVETEPTAFALTVRCSPNIVTAAGAPSCHVGMTFYKPYAVENVPCTDVDSNTFTQY